MVSLVAFCGMAQAQEGPAVPASIVRSCSDAVVRALRERDMATVAFFAHPSLGLRFAPYPYLTSADHVFSPDQTRSLLANQTVRTWGRFDGTGDPIRGTFRDYFPQFVWKRDFSAADITVGENIRLRTAHHTSNWASVYPGRQFVEYHYAGSEQYGNLDWWTLVLVWKRDQYGAWRLVCVTNDMHGV
ncbi:MAG: hypothetical protein KIT11_06950 [Fimbriimonadaceae bacterium]|nr:hypothetical protein [Fimbriimonadaceae bacterium]QYK56090.1 MAG: hypothetical protein KF733_01140 [Fimbriimonadaceae bacterium]